MDNLHDSNKSMTTQTEALKLALEALEDNQHLVADNERHAYVMEYNDLIEKCKEVLAQQSNISELKEKTANHNVDCLCANCSMLDDLEDATAQPEQHQDWCASLTQLLMSMPPKPAPCNCKPLQRTWVGLTDGEFMYFCSYVRADVLSEIETKLKELNT